MSYKAIIVPENPTNNGYILKPLVASVLAACGKPNARVDVITNPRTNGYEHAKSLIKTELISRYRFVDVLLFLPDADGKDRSAEFAALEGEAETAGTKLVCCAAVQEVEVWLLAGYSDRLRSSWAEVRQSVSVKEEYFLPFISSYGDAKKPGHGRKDLMSLTLQNYEGLKARCPELQDFEDRLKALVNAGS